MLSCLGGSRTKRPPKQSPLAGKHFANNINQTQRPLRNIQHSYHQQQQQPCRPHQPLPYPHNFTTAQDGAHVVAIDPQHHLPRVQNPAGPQRPTLIQQQKNACSFTSSAPYTPATAAPYSARRVPEQQQKRQQWQRPMVYPADGSRTALPRNASSGVVGDSSVIITRPPATAMSHASRRRSSARSSMFSLCKNMTGLSGSEELGHFSSSASSSSEALLGDVIARPARAAAERRSSRTMTVCSNNRGSMFSLCKNLTGLPGSELGFGMGGYHNLDEQKSEVEHESDLSSMRGGATGPGLSSQLAEGLTGMLHGLRCPDPRNLTSPSPALARCQIPTSAGHIRRRLPRR